MGSGESVSDVYLPVSRVSGSTGHGLVNVHTVDGTIDISSYTLTTYTSLLPTRELRIIKREPACPMSRTTYLVATFSQTISYSER